MITKEGKDWQPTDEQVAQWQHAYKEVDVFSELDAMACWLDANPTRRKTNRGMAKFVNSWLSRANKTGGSPAHFKREEVPGEPIPARQWTMLDMLTHNFMDSPEMAQKWLQEHGQYVDAKGVRHVR